MKRKTDGFTKKLMIPESEIPECPELRSQIKNKKHILKQKNT